METMETTKTIANHSIFNELCLAWGTQLMMPEGIKPIDSLQTGEIIMASRGSREERPISACNGKRQGLDIAIA
jgi:hypothetical protein